MLSGSRWGRSAAILGAVILTGPAMAAEYQTNLGPMPLDDETKAVIAGRGDATASYDGRTLTVKGRFAGLPSDATDAHLFLGEHIGVPGHAVLDLMLTKSTSGALSGSFALTAEQANALRLGHLYVQINSEKAPPAYSWGPKGTLWGWLLPAHRMAGQDVPQSGHWFIPQLDTPSR
jgi:hypothetical protein